MAYNTLKVVVNIWLLISIFEGLCLILFCSCLSVSFLSETETDEEPNNLSKHKSSSLSNKSDLCLSKIFLCFRCLFSSAGLYKDNDGSLCFISLLNSSFSLFLTMFSQLSLREASFVVIISFLQVLFLTLLSSLSQSWKVHY